RGEVPPDIYDRSDRFDGVDITVGIRIPCGRSVRGDIDGGQAISRRSPHQGEEAAYVYAATAECDVVHLVVDIWVPGQQGPRCVDCGKTVAGDNANLREKAADIEG